MRKIDGLQHALPSRRQRSGGLRLNGLNTHDLETACLPRVDLLTATHREQLYDTGTDAFVQRMLFGWTVIEVHKQPQTRSLCIRPNDELDKVTCFVA